MDLIGTSSMMSFWEEKFPERHTTEMEGAGVYRSCIKEGIHLKREKLFRLILTHYSVTG